MPNSISAQLTPEGNDSLQRVVEGLECKSETVEDQLEFKLSQNYKKPRGTADQGRCED